MRSLDLAARGLAAPGALAFALALLLALAPQGANAEDSPDPESTPESTPETTPGGELTEAEEALLRGEGGTEGDVDAEAPAEAEEATPAEADGAEAESDRADIPANVRLRQLQRDVQGLKERAWRSKAQINMLQENVLGGGLSTRASIVHENDMGGTFQLVRLVYALDGEEIFARSGDDLDARDAIEVLSSPLPAGSHTLSVVAEYEGHGYGLFRYVDDYTFTVRSSHTFNVVEGHGTTVEVRGYERGGATVPLEDRPAFEFNVSTAQATEEESGD